VKSATSNKGWQRGIALVLCENDIVEATIALKHYHKDLCKNIGSQLDWPEVRQSIRGIVSKLYHARGIEDNDPLEAK